MESTQNFTGMDFMNGSSIMAAQIFGLVCFISFIWEHVCRKHKSQIRPSTALNFLAEQSQLLFTNIGKGFAWISSFLVQNDIQEICITVWDLIRPIGELVISPFYLFYGYGMKAVSYVGKQELIYLGSVIIIGMLAFGVGKLVNLF